MNAIPDYELTSLRDASDRHRMAGERLECRWEAWAIRKVDQGCTQRDIAQTSGHSLTTIHRMLKRAQERRAS